MPSPVNHYYKGLRNSLRPLLAVKEFNRSDAVWPPERYYFDHDDALQHCTSCAEPDGSPHLEQCAWPKIDEILGVKTLTKERICATCLGRGWVSVITKTWGTDSLGTRTCPDCKGIEQSEAFEEGVDAGMKARDAEWREDIRRLLAAHTEQFSYGGEKVVPVEYIEALL